MLLALRYGAEAGCLTGFALGLAQDAVAGGPLGLGALSKAFVGFVVGDLPALDPGHAADRAGGPRRRWPPSSTGLARFALLQLFHYPAPLGELFTRVIVPQAGYNGILAAAMVWPVGRLLSRG